VKGFSHRRVVDGARSLDVSIARPMVTRSEIVESRPKEAGSPWREDLVRPFPKSGSGTLSLRKCVAFRPRGVLMRSLNTCRKGCSALVSTAKARAWNAALDAMGVESGNVTGRRPARAEMKVSLSQASLMLHALAMFLSAYSLPVVMEEPYNPGQCQPYGQLDFPESRLPNELRGCHQKWLQINCEAQARSRRYCDSRLLHQVQPAAYRR
jgi:hypothetical protein